MFITFSPRTNSSRTEACLTHYYGLNCVPLPPNSQVDALTMSMTVFGDRTPKRKLRLNEVIRMRPSSRRTGVLIRRRRDTIDGQVHR